MLKLEFVFWWKSFVMYSVKFSFFKKKTFHDCWNWADRKYNILVMQCLLFGWWIMEVMPIMFYTNMLSFNGQPLWYQAYLPNLNATDLLFLYVKKIQKFLRFQSFFVCFSFRLSREKKKKIDRSIQERPAPAKRQRSNLSYMPPWSYTTHPPPFT